MNNSHNHFTSMQNEDCKVQGDLTNLRIQGVKGSRGQEINKIPLESLSPRTLESFKPTLNPNNNIYQRRNVEEIYPIVYRYCTFTH